MALNIIINRVATVISFPANTKVADLSATGGTAPYTYTLATGGTNFQIVGTEVRTKAIMDINNIASFSITVTDSTSASATSEITYPRIQAAVQNRFNVANTIFVITKDIDLGHGELIMLNNCTLDFDGGVITNGTIVFQNTKLKYRGGTIFDNTIDFLRINNLLSPLKPEMFGLVQTDDGSNYDRLLLMYKLAKSINATISWEGYANSTITLTTLRTTPIQLLQVNDFCGVTFEVKNTQQNITLFSAKGGEFGKLTTADSVIKPYLESLDYSAVPEIGTGTGLWLLKVHDVTTWTVRTDTTPTAVDRYDLILINDGLAYNYPIYSYTQGSPTFEYVRVDSAPTIIKNLQVVRVAGCTAITYALSISNLNNVLIENMEVVTKEVNGLSHDAAIQANDCSNLTFINVTVNSIYDTTGYAYGFSFNNIYNLVMDRINTSNYNWGVMGNNYLNTVTMTNSNLNRFDLHLYGRDFQFIHCQFKKTYNQFCNVYGQIIFDGCQFNNTTPILYEGSYNVWTGHDVTFKNCTFKNVTTLFNLYRLDNTVNSRPELSQKCLPNVNVEYCVFTTPVNGINLFTVPEGTMPVLGHIDHVYINGLKYIDPTGIPSFTIANKGLSTLNAIKVIANNVSLLPDSDDGIVDETTKYSPIGGFYFGNLSKVEGINTVEIDSSRLSLTANSAPSYYTIARNSTIANMRYEDSNNPSVFENCNIYLNNIDDDFYTLRANATYIGCKFYKVTTSKNVTLYRTGEYKFYKCTKNISTALLPNGIAGSNELRGSIAIKTTDIKYILDDDLQRMGATSDRPSLTSAYYAEFFDTTLGKKILWNGTAWVNMDGTALA